MTEQDLHNPVLSALPVGVLVIDAQTHKPVQFNARAEEILGREINPNAAFRAANYDIQRTNTSTIYPDDELPIFMVRTEPMQVDDIVITHSDGEEVAVMMSAAPILDNGGRPTRIVVTLTDISNLRALENTLQDNLRDTIALYEAVRSIAEAESVNDVYDILLMHLSILEPDVAYVVIVDEHGIPQATRSYNDGAGRYPLSAETLTSTHNLFVGDVTSSSEISDTLRTELKAASIGGLVSIGLRGHSKGNKTIGWLVLVFREPRQLTPEQERFLSALSDSASVSLDMRARMVR